MQWEEMAQEVNSPRTSKTDAKDIVTTALELDMSSLVEPDGFGILAVAEELAVAEPVWVVLDTGAIFASEATLDQVAAWSVLALPLPSRYGRYDTIPLLESWTNEVIPAKYVACGSFMVGPASCWVVFVSTLIT